MRLGSELEEFAYAQIQCFLYSMEVTPTATLSLTPSDTPGVLCDATGPIPCSPES